MRTFLFVALASLAFGCSSKDDAGTALKPPPAPNTSTAPGTADPRAMPGTPGATMPTPGATTG